MRTFLILLFTSLAAFAGEQAIYVKADQSFRGPYTHAEPLAEGETIVVLTAEQYAAVDAMRHAHPVCHLAFNGTTFVLSPADIVREPLLMQFSALPAEQKAFYAPAYSAVKAMLDAGNVTGAKNIIAWLRTPTDELAATQQQMLALFPAE